ncbi:MAG: hypothetical protein R2744_06470 [Bacteroidales bacterium]
MPFLSFTPSLNQILRHLNGRLDLIGKIKFLYYRNSGAMTRMRAVVAGVHPSYQNSGIESAIFKHLYEVFKRKRGIRARTLMGRNFNPKMISIYEAIGAERMKIHITYRYLVDRNEPFVRYRDEMALT